MQAQSIKISKLKSNSGQINGLPRNPRLIKDDKYKKLVKSIIDDPEMLELRELIVFPFEKDFVVIAGNMRLKAMEELGYKECPCKVLSSNTTVEKLKAYTIKDNVGFGEHDWDELANNWDSEKLADWGVDSGGFDLNPDGLGEGFTLPDGDKAPFQQMTFTLADAQAERIKAALTEVEIMDGTQYGNENSNGNALHQIVLEWDEQRR